MTLRARAGTSAVIAAACGASIWVTVVRDGAGQEPPPTADNPESCECPVTRPDTDGTRDGAHGTRSLATTLGPKATVFAARDPQRRPRGTLLGHHQDDGSVYAKFLWTRGRRGTGVLRVAGRELQTGDEGLRLRVDQSLRDTPYIPSALIFSRAGCWLVKARAGKARLSFVVRVVDELGE